MSFVHRSEQVPQSLCRRLLSVPVYWALQQGLGTGAGGGGASVQGAQPHEETDRHRPR